MSTSANTDPSSAVSATQRGVLDAVSRLASYPDVHEMIANLLGNCASSYECEVAGNMLQALMLAHDANTTPKGAAGSRAEAGPLRTKWRFVTIYADGTQRTGISSFEYDEPVSAETARADMARHDQGDKFVVVPDHPVSVDMNERIQLTEKIAVVQDGGDWHVETDGMRHGPAFAERIEAIRWAVSDGVPAEQSSAGASHSKNSTNMSARPTDADGFEGLVNEDELLDNPRFFKPEYAPPPQDEIEATRQRKAAKQAAG